LVSGETLQLYTALLFMHYNVVHHAESDKPTAGASGAPAATLRGASVEGAAVKSVKKDRMSWRWRKYLAGCALGLAGMLGATVMSYDRLSFGIFAVGMLLFAFMRWCMRTELEAREHEGTKMTEARMLHVMQLRKHLPEKLPEGWTDLHANFQGWYAQVGPDVIGIWTRDEEPHKLRVSFSRDDGKSDPDMERMVEELRQIRGVGRFEPVGPRFRGYVQVEAARVEEGKEAERARRERARLN
jgi:hypothetical protein